jgi:hypothetical protein
MGASSGVGNDPGPGATTTEASATGILARLFGAPPPTPRRREPHARPADTGVETVVFVCTTCGRTDLPEAGDWDPPICLECDAAINFDAEMEQVWDEEGGGG